MSEVETRLEEAGLTVPELAAPPAAAYVPSRTAGNIVYVSGQLPLTDGKPFKTGHLGDDVSVEDGQATAAVCALNVIAQLKAACGDLDKVKQVLKLEILVACTPDFTEPHVVANGASSTILKAFGDEVGAHARVAYGVSSLPMGVAVEVAATFEI